MLGDSVRGALMSLLKVVSLQDLMGLSRQLSFRAFGPPDLDRVPASIRLSAEVFQNHLRLPSQEVPVPELCPRFC